MAGKFGSMVEGDRPSQRRGHWLEQLDEGVGDGIGLEAVLGHGDGEPRVAFMCEEDRLSGGGEEHGIGLPMACLLAGGNAVGAVVDRGTIGVARPAALGTPSPLVFGARWVEEPAPGLGVCAVGVR